MTAARTIDRVFAAGLLLLGAYIVRSAIAYGYMRDAVPGPGFFPFWIGLGLAALSAVNLVRSVRGHERLDARFDRPTFLKTLAITAIVLAFVVASQWVGMLVAIGAAIPAIGFVIRRQYTTRFAVTMAALAVGFPLLAYLLFGVYLRVPLVRGPFGF